MQDEDCGTPPPFTIEDEARACLHLIDRFLKVLPKEKGDAFAEKIASELASLLTGAPGGASSGRARGGTAADPPRTTI